MVDTNTRNTDLTNDEMLDDDDTVARGTLDKNATEPATKHDVGIGGGIGAVGGAIVGGLAGGPIGAVIGAIAGGAASAGAVDVVDKHDHDYGRTAHGTDTAVTGTTGYAGTTTPTGTYADTTATAPTGTYADTTTTAPAGTYADTNTYNDTAVADGTQRVQLRDEELRADTQQVAAGEVHIHKDVITENRSIDVPVTREEVVIERHPVNAAYAGTADFNQADQEIRIPVMEEQVTLAKNTVVREEVEVGKRAVTETQHLTGTVQHEELRVDDSTGNVVSDTTNPR